MTGVSTLGQALRQIQNIKSQQSLLSQLSTQMASGKKTNSFAGLNIDTLPSLRSRTEFRSLEIYSNNLKKADIRIGIMLKSVEEFQAQSRNMSQVITTFIQEGSHQRGDRVYYDDPMTPENDEIEVGNTSSQMDNSFTTMQGQADNLYNFLVDLLNAREGDRFVFAGSDAFTKPLNDTGTLDAAMSTLIQRWKDGAISTDDMIASLTQRNALNGNPNALTDSIVGYSPQLSSGNTGEVFVRASEDSEFKYTTLANEDPFRDIIVALAFLKNPNLPPIVDVYPDGVYPGVPTAQGAPGQTAAEMQENFYAVFNRVVKMVVEGIDKIDQVRYRMETVRVQMGETEKANRSERELLLNTIADVEDVDTNEVAVRLNTVRVQLEASYRVTAITSQLSLVNFLR